MKRRSQIVGAAVVAAVLLLAAGALILRKGILPSDPGSRSPNSPRPALSIVLADFSNHTGESIFDNTLEPIVKLTLEGSGFITTYDRTQLRSLGVPSSSEKLDEQAARRIAIGQGLGAVVTAILTHDSGGYLLALKATQAVTGETLSIVEGQARDKDEVIPITAKVAQGIRVALGDSSSESHLRFANDTLTTTSLEAVHEYAKARIAMSNGKFQDAFDNFRRAVDIDSQFGVAYGGVAIAAGALGQQQDAEKYIRLALEHLDSMTERERYRVRASYFLLLGDQHKCVEEYRALVGRFPSDAVAHNNLALCLTRLRRWPEALEEVRQAALILPKNTLYRNNLALYLSYEGNFADGEREARTVQESAPSFTLGFMSLAFAHLGQGRLTDADETYRRLDKSGALGSSYASAGLGDVALFEGRFGDAVQILERGTAADLAAGYSDRAASKLAVIAYTHLLHQQKQLAVAAAEKAIEASKTAGIKFLAARVFVAADEVARANVLAAALRSDSQGEPQVYARLVEGEIALARGDSALAMRIFNDANTSLDTWVGHFDLGQAYLAAGESAEAEKEFNRCIERRGEALSLFLDEVPTYGYLPPVYYYLGRARQDLKSARSDESYRSYLAIREKAGEDPLIADIRKRLNP